MKLSSIKPDRRHNHCYSFVESVLLEAQIDFLINRYPDVDPDLIQQAIALDPGNALKLVHGLSIGLISEITPRSIVDVAGLDPLRRQKNKSETEIARDAERKRARDRAREMGGELGIKYWMWVENVLKNEPDAQIDREIFHYLDDEEIDVTEIKDISLADMNERYAAWREEVLRQQREGIRYISTPRTDGIFTHGIYTWVPVIREESRLEGRNMQNCIGTHVVPADTIKVYSMRTKDNTPVVSLSVYYGQPENRYRRELAWPGGHWFVNEVKGKQNVAPIDKYKPHTIAFILHLITTGVKLPSSGDVWNNLTHPDQTQLVPHYEHAVNTLPKDLIMRITDESLNQLIERNGFTDAFYGMGDTQSFDFILSRMNANNFVRTIVGNGTANIALLKKGMALGVVSRDVAERLLGETAQSPRIQLLLLARYEPEQFLESMRNVEPYEFIARRDFFIDAIEVCQTHDEYFFELYSFFERRENEGQWQQNIQPGAGRYNVMDRLGSKAQLLLARTPLERLRADLETARETQQYKQDHLDMFLILMNDAILSDDQDDIRNTRMLSTLQLLPPNTNFNRHSPYIPSLDPLSIILEFEFDNLIDAYNAGRHNNAFAEAALEFLKGIREIRRESGLQVRGGSVLSGTRRELADGMEAILHAHTTEEILEVMRRFPTYRAIQRMGNKKIQTRRNQEAGDNQNVR